MAESFEEAIAEYLSLALLITLEAGRISHESSDKVSRFAHSNSESIRLNSTIKDYTKSGTRAIQQIATLDADRQSENARR